MTLPPNVSIPWNGSHQLRLGALTARKAMRLVEAKTWPPQNISFHRLSELLGFLSNKSTLNTNYSLTCNKDLTVDETRQCCYLSCLNWQWLTNSQESVDTFLFVVNLIFGLIAFPSTSVFVLGLIRKKEYEESILACLRIGIRAL